MALELLKAWAPLGVIILVWIGFAIYVARLRGRIPEVPAELGGPPDSLTIARTRGYVAILRRFTVLVDGAAVGKIGPGEVKHFSVNPGPHTVAMKIDWCGSPNVAIEKKLGENVPLRCGVKLDDWRCVYAPFFRPRQCLYVSNDG